MGNTVHNAVVKTFAEGMFPGCVGPSYIQTDQMNFAPLETAMEAALSAPNSRPEASNSQTSTHSTTATSTTPVDPIYSTPPPVPTAMQEGSTSGYPNGWNPATGLGMPLELFNISSAAQFNASATQPMTPQQSASAAQPNAQNTWNPQMAAQLNASVPPPMTPQQHLALILQPKSPSEILISMSPHQGAVN